MASVSYQIANLLEKMTSSDKDFRFMATNDLMTELQKDSIKLDDDSERKVVKMLLRLLEDKNGEVQNLAVKCLGPLVNKVKEYQVESIVETLCANMLSDTEQLRDISSIGLKTVISELPLGSNTLAANVCKKITGRLSSAIEKQEDVSVQLEALDILADLLSRFGGLLISFHPLLLNSLLPQLASPRQAVRKRTIVALSHLVMSCNASLYNKLIDHLLEGLGSSTSSSVSRTHIQCIASVCRQAGHRFGEQLWRVAPQVLEHSNDADEELREHCLQALEAFVLKCPKEVQPHIPTIIDLCLKMITYDPNYNYEDEEEDGGGEDEEMEDESFAPDAEPESDSEEYSDDDDMSWKVRRAAAKCLESVIATRHELLSEMYQSVSPALIARFKEREENVKCDILSAYTALLRATRPPPALQMNMAPAADSPQALLIQRVPGVVRGALRVIRGRSVRARGCALALLRELLAAAPGCLADHAARVVRALTPALTDKSTASSMKIETLVFVVCLLRGHAAGAMRAHVAALTPAVLACVHDPFYKVTAEALRVLQTLVKVIRPLDTLVFVVCLLRAHVAALTPAVLACVHDPFYKVTAEALRVLQTLVKVIRPLDNIEMIEGSDEVHVEPPPEELQQFIPAMYECTLVRLRATDMDQEVKERAIATCGQLICHFGDYLQNELPVCLPIFLERLRNEITRLTTVKALTKIASSPLRIDLRPILSDVVPILGSFLRKNQRALKLSTLVLLDTLVQNYSNDISIELLSKVLMEVPPLVCESDLHCAQTALALVRGACVRCPAALTADARQALTPNILALAKSPLLQGGALKAMLSVLSALVAADVAGCSRRELLALLVAPVHRVHDHNATAHHIKQVTHSSAGDAERAERAGGARAPRARPQRHRAPHQAGDAQVAQAMLSVLSALVAPVHRVHDHNATAHHIKQAFHSLAKCVAAVVVAGGQAEALEVVRGFLRDAAHPPSDPTHMFALLALAEIGRHLDLSSIPNLKEVLLNSFTPSSEEVKSAASYALGSVAVGNLPEFLPFILREIEAQPKRQYLLLHSLREIISCESCTPEGVEALRPFIPEIWVQLSKHCQCAEEGSRNVVAECLGKLCLLEPQDLLPHLKEFLKSPEPLTRTTAVTAVKFTISDQPQAIDPLLRACMAELLVPLRDPALGVRRVALVAFNSAAHNKPSLIRDLLPSVLPTIYSETKVKKELIREVEMGPFKHSVDDGLDLRKAAFECMYTLLGSCLDRLDVFEFLRHVEDGLRDHYDIKMLTYLMCARLAQLCPAVVLQRLESLVEPLRATCTMKVKANSVKQEYEKQDELKRSALRAAAALLQIPEAEKNPHLMDFVTQIKSFPDLQPIFEAILKDASGGGVDANLMDQS
ncbi:cullin-associated NEDD8-dissociated protein 1 [Ostrinia nubilalis]|uniref:cullin-associated NEDD8-dissociated protein 1 n=1 Tax=Ostrinia nubilalis TaxID=29057 RepID=UPI0030825C60